MFRKVKKDSSVKHILIINMSNIGDVLLSAPAMDIILRDFPKARISLVIGPRATSIFDGNKRIEKIYIFEKKANVLKQVYWFLRLNRHRYDLIIDFRRTFIGFLLFPKWITPLTGKVDKEVHLKDRHLNRLRTVYDFNLEPVIHAIVAPSKNDEIFVDALLQNFLKDKEPFVAIAPIAADKAKTWTPQGFIEVSNAIGKEYGYKIILLGSEKDQETLAYIQNRIDYPVLNLAGRTNLLQAAALINRAAMVIVHDSGPMHIASYMNKPTIALFGPTDPLRSRPWGEHYGVVHHNQECPRCSNPASHVPHMCMAAITPHHVMQAFQGVHHAVYN